LDLIDMSVSRYGLIKNSECVCSRPTDDNPEQARLNLRLRRKADPDAYRLQRPEDVPLPLAALANPVAGMIGAPGLADHSPTATAPVTGFFISRGMFGLFPVWWSGHGEAFEKSERLAVLEGIERYAGQYPRARRLASDAPAAALAERYLDPRDLPPYPEAFYTENHGHYVRWTPDLPCNWVWGYSLKSREPILVPEQMAYYLLRPGGKPCFTQECSNGCAAGSTVEEAILHGLLELVERDAFLLHWYGKLAAPEIAMSSIRSSVTRAMAARVDLLGWDLHCFDMRVDLSVPVIGAVAVRRPGGQGGLCYAAGCSLSAEDAVRAAVCEVASYVPNLEKRARSDERRAHEMAADFREVRLLEDHTLVHTAPEMRAHSAFLLEQTRTLDLDELYPKSNVAARLDLREDVIAVADEIMGLGSDLIVVDQTPPEQASLGMHTMKTLAPGLMPIDFGWDKQRVLQGSRLRTAPVSAGMRKQPLTDRQLNWVPHPFP
jgi:ribosomal protein S12 methylthiotransferase accessory factor